MKNTIIYIFAVILSSMLISCKSTRQIEYRDRDVVQIQIKEVHDTTLIEAHDSVYHIIKQVGDTVYNTIYKEKIKYKDRVIHKVDTLWRDSLQTEYIEKIVEKKYIPKWCYICLCISVFLITFAIVNIRSWIRKKL